MVFENCNGFGRTYLRECYVYLVTINGVPCSVFSSETEANEVCDTLLKSLSDVSDYLDICCKQIKFYSHW